MKPGDTSPDFSYEFQAMQSGARLIAGVDEVGRGSLAGPVVVAAVILYPDNLPQGINDSKKLARTRRRHLFTEIMSQARAISIGSIKAMQIDQINIRQATLTAMRHAICSLEPRPDLALIDGCDIPSALPCTAQALIKGDCRSISIASASIIAKVVRDSMMDVVAENFPDYGFENHVGYGTKAHLTALSRLGAVKKLHRFSFSSVKT